MEERVEEAATSAGPASSAATSACLASSTDEGGVLSSPHAPPDAEALKFIEQELHRKQEQTAERQAQLGKLRAAQAAEAAEVEEAGAPAMRMRHLVQQADVLTALSQASRGGKAGGKAPSKGQGRLRAGRMSEKEEDELLLKQSDAHGQTRLLVQPACITGEMRTYQLEGLNWLIRAYESGVNGILADEMGLGKTLQTISLLGYLKTQLGLAGPHLVIAPKSTIGNWFNEVRRWCPSLCAFKFHGDKESRKALREQVLSPGRFDVCITTYEMVLSEKAALGHLSWSFLIIDEAHRIKNDQSSLSQVVRLFRANHRLLITGTPLQNNLHELWALLNFLLPDVFSDADAFDEWLSADSSDGGAGSVVGQLHTLLKPVLLRRLKAEVEKNLPPKRELKLHVGLSEMQRFWYSSILGKNIDALNDVGANKVCSAVLTSGPLRPLPTASECRRGTHPPTAVRLTGAHAQHPHAAAQVRQPPVPLRRRGAASLHQRPAPRRQQRQARPARQAAPTAGGGRAPSAHLLADDADARHPRGLPVVPAAPLLPHRRLDRLGRPRGAHRRLQRAGLRVLCLPALHARGRAGHQPDLRRHRHSLRLRLEPAGAAGTPQRAAPGPQRATFGLAFAGPCVAGTCWAGGGWSGEGGGGGRGGGGGGGGG